MQDSFDVGDGNDAFAVACAVFSFDDGASLNVTVQRQASPFWIEAVTLGRDHEVRMTSSGGQLVLLEVPKSFRQAVMRRSTGLMVNVTASGLLGRGVPIPFSLPELRELVRQLDTEFIEMVFPAESPSATSRTTSVVHVPSVVGMPVETARQILDHVGLSSWVVEVRPSNASVPDGVVTAQDPPAGSRIEQDHAVRLSLARVDL